MIVSIAASNIAHNPSETLRICEGIWKYLGVTVDEKILFPLESKTEFVLKVSTDAASGDCAGR